MKRLTLLLLAILAMAALAGCNSSSSVNPGATDANKFEVAAVVSADESADPDLAGISLDDEPMEELGPGMGSGFAGALAIVPDSVRICWYRHLSHTTKDVSATGDTTLMTVTVSRMNDGVLRGQVCERGGKGRGRGDGRDTVLYTKNYSVTWTRSAELAKVAVASEENEEHSRWKLLRTTLAHTTQTAPSVPTPQILSVTVIGRDSLGAPDSVVFTDPGAMFDPRTLPLFGPGDNVVVKVVTDSPADRMVFMHFDMASSDRGRCQRLGLPFIAAQNAFVGVFKVARPHHGNGRGMAPASEDAKVRPRSAVWVDVISKATIRDTEAPYAATGWGVPYRLRRPAPPSLALGN
ncbi:MAG: hypothetical protein HZB25_14090 [Candidatus Eisenbacteria bacterium]|nr:hypothetical protein [Candidatus Eisenbacteria bacterium]